MCVCVRALDRVKWRSNILLSGLRKKKTKKRTKRAARSKSNSHSLERQSSARDSPQSCARTFDNCAPSKAHTTRALSARERESTKVAHEQIGELARAPLLTDCESPQCESIGRDITCKQRRAHKLRQATNRTNRPIGQLAASQPRRFVVSFNSSVVVVYWRAHIRARTHARPQLRNKNTQIIIAQRDLNTARRCYVRAPRNL